MRLLTGSVLALLVAGVVYFNLVAPERAPEGDVPAAGMTELAQPAADVDLSDVEPANGVQAPLVESVDGGSSRAVDAPAIDVRVKVVDSGGSPLAGMQVEVVPQGGAEALAAAVTDADGALALGGLAPGLYQLRVDPASASDAGFARPWQPELCRGPSFPDGIGSECFAVLGDGRASDHEVVLVRAGTLVGELLDARGRPVEGAPVKARVRHRGLERCEATTLTDSLGTYTLALVPGPYQVTIDAAPRPTTFDVTVPEGVVVSGPTAPLVADDAADVSPTAAIEPTPSADVELTGRVLSTFGEPLAGFEVVVLQGTTELATSETDAAGEWTIAGVPAAALTAVVRGSRLTSPAAPVEVRPREGQRRVRVPDLLVDVRRVFRIAGRVVVDPADLEAYRAELSERTGGGVDLDPAQTLAAYLRGLRLEQRNVGATRATRGARVPVEPDGRFSWSCTLPADDVEFVLTARGGRSAVRGESVRLMVTPAGDRTVDVELLFPPRPAVEGSGDAAS